jgi:hypothetical protein
MTTYFLAGMVAYPLLTKQFYEGPHAVLAVFLRTEAEPELFRHAANRAVRSGSSPSLAAWPDSN